MQALRIVKAFPLKPEQRDQKKRGVTAPPEKDFPEIREVFT
jgi:hypothetical protein